MSNLKETIQEFTNDEIIAAVFGDETKENLPFEDKKMYKQTGTKLKEQISMKPVSYRKQEMVPSSNKDPENQIETITDSQILERRRTDFSDALLNTQINNIRKKKGFISFILD